VPLLFNRWRDPVCDFGGVSLEHIVPGLTYSNENRQDLFSYYEAEWPRPPVRIERTHKAYLEAVVGAHKDDPRIFCWDLCNEPLMAHYAEDDSSPLQRAEVQWLTWCYKTCKRIGATQPLTIGNFPGLKQMQLTEPISDIISTHPYFVWNAPGADKAKYEASLDQYVAFAQSKGKELLSSETVWGAVDDDQRVTVLRYTLAELCKRNMGFVVHALQHSLVADLHYPAYGPVRDPGSMQFVNPDGSLRKGHEAFNDYC
jgi:hypothetical protein